MPVRIKERGVQTEALWVHQCLSPGKGKPQSTNAFRPNFKFVTTTPKNDVVAVNFNWHRARDEITKGEVILEAQKRERQKIPHQLSPLLLANNASRIPNLSP